VVFILGVEVEWHLLALILISTHVLIFINIKAEIMPISLDKHI
jgi:hypothetical protein